MNSSKAEGPKSSFGRSTMLVLAVTLHNLPEGMAVGVVYAGWLSGDAGITAMGALALSLGIAIQNFPEGAIISMPLRAEGAGRGKAFLYGALSGAVEPIGAALTLLAAHYVVPFLPYLLSFAAGAMVYVVVEELIPEMSEGKTFQFGDNSVCCRFYNYDGAGCGPGIAGQKDSPMPGMVRTGNTEYAVPPFSDGKSRRPASRGHLSGLRQ